MTLDPAGSDVQPIRTLAVDGGGIRGIVPSVVLVALQERLTRPRPSRASMAPCGTSSTAGSDWGAIGWATRILEVLTDGQSGMSENNLKHLSKSRERVGSSYARFQPDVLHVAERRA